MHKIIYSRQNKLNTKYIELVKTAKHFFNSIIDVMLDNHALV